MHFDTPCEYFTAGKAKASTLSLSVLVAIEMFNALNALSEVCLQTASSLLCQHCADALEELGESASSAAFLSAPVA